VILSFVSQNVSEVQFGTASTPKNVYQVVFQPSNFNVPQTVPLLATADSGQGTVTVQITSTVTTTDANYSTAPTPSVTVTKGNSATGGGGGSTGGGTTTVGPTTFSPNTRYAVSFPYFFTNKKTTLNDVFNMSQSAAGFKLFKFRVSYQSGALLPAGSPTTAAPTGQAPTTDYFEVTPTEALERGRGYLLITGGSGISFKGASSGGLQPLPTPAAGVNPTFSFKMWRNTNFYPGYPAPNTNQQNGLNMIGFPFDTSKYQRFSFNDVAVQFGGQTYTTLTAAVAAGLMSPQLYTVDSQGKLVAVSDSNNFITANNAYFVQMYRDNVTLIMQKPSVN
jgi:hypothetical protein